MMQNSPTRSQPVMLERKTQSRRRSLRSLRKSTRS